ncbi:MAG: hypothetical protein M3R38_19900 [Actinomycetota bacterium]|nr:hypothetical protein [Actinomycetota bacterium]
MSAANAALSSTLALLRIEFRRSVGLLCFPLLVVAAGWLAKDSMPVGVYTWLDTSGAIRETVPFVGAFVAGISAWTAGRNKRRGMADLLSSTPRSLAARDLTTWAGTALWGAAVYVTLAAVLLSVTWWNATWGAPPAGYLLVGLLAVLANSAVGYAAGHYLPSRFITPLVAIGLFVAQFAPINYLSVAPLLPASTFLVGLDVFMEVPKVALQQGLWFCGVGAVALAAVVAKSRRGDAASWTLLAGALLLCAAGFAASMLAVYRQGSFFADEAAPFEYVCEEGGITVCVHPAYEKLLPQAAGVVNEVGEPLAGIPGAPTRAMQVGSLTPEPARKAESTAFFTADSIVDGGNVGWFRQEVAMHLVEGPAAYQGSAPEAKPTEEDLERCGPGAKEGFVDPALEARAVVANWLFKQLDRHESGFSLAQCPNAHRLVHRFANLDPVKRRAWLKENLAGLRAGEVTLKDLP